MAVVAYRLRRHARALPESVAALARGEDMKRLVVSCAIVAGALSGCMPARVFEMPWGEKVILLKYPDGERPQINCVPREECLQKAENVCGSAFDIAAETMLLDPPGYSMEVRCANPAPLWLETESAH
jgi:hypothetical protein